ncbi:MAG TPA: tRNA (guanosine(37)-N1)-methyltransferase TrmD [Firmicutes bacterium]|nr:tRNA (guanosine(37)-N1)-methyltransferase TrmD [Bacillota bacterium]
MKIDILSLFPGMFEGFLNESIIKRAIDKGIIEINVINFRDYSKMNNHQVDDTIYGGGPGMLLRCEPIFDCIDDIKTPESKIAILTPEGKVFNQKTAKEFKNIKHLIMICGHYEGFDERIKTLADFEISIGDFVLTGGEIPAMAIIDATARLLPGVINDESLDSEAFEDGLLDYPSYTKPAEYRGMKVPDVLLSGNHQNIDEWRKAERIKRTKEKRPDLFKED